MAVTRAQALHQARQEHEITLHSDGIHDLGATWSCSCGKGSPSRLLKPSRPQARAHAERHIQAVARQILKES